MNKLIRAALLLGVCCGLLLPVARAQDGLTSSVYKVSIRHVGPPAVSDSLILANVRVEVGSRFNRNAIDDDVRNLYTTGYFYNIVVLDEYDPAQGYHLIYLVQGNPLLTDIRFEGNTKYKDSKLQKTITAKVGKPLNDRELHQDVQAIKKLYQKAGYPGTTVKYVPSIDEQAGRATATFQITETPKIRIQDVVFEGASAVSQKKLRKALKTRRWWMFSWLTGSGSYKEDEFEMDRDRLADFYRNLGYLDFELKDVKLDYPEPNRMVLRLQVFEGRQYQVGSVGFSGVTLVDTNAVMEKLAMPAGETFTPGGFFNDIEVVEDAYGAIGHIDVRVRPQRNANVETGNMDLVYDVTEGQRVFIERIDIRGNTKTKDRVIRRELLVNPGEPFNKVLVKVSTNRIGLLNYFEKISWDHEQTEIPNRRNLVLDVEEKNTGNFQIGAGLSSIDNLVGFAEVTQSNFDLFNPPYFTGGGQKANLRVQMGTSRQDYMLSFEEPWMFGRKLIFNQELYHRELNFQSSLYNERRTGSSTSFTRPLGSERFRATVSYTIEKVGLLDVSPSASPAIQEEEGLQLISEAGLRLTYDQRYGYGPLTGGLPTRGYRTILDTGIAGGPFGADADFYRLELRHTHYFPGFGEGHVLEIMGRAGVTENYGRSDSVPLFNRWFLGGAFSMRGFDYREIGPKDIAGEPLGGETYWFGSAEYSIPIIDRVRFAVFYDIGMVYQDAYSFDSKVYDRNGNFILDTGTYNDNFGFGIRLNLPIGPLVFDYGIPITSDPRNDSSGRFQFRAGYQRDF